MLYISDFLCKSLACKQFYNLCCNFIRVYSGEKVADCINFWNPSTDTVFQSFRHAFRDFYFLKRNLCSRCLHLDSSVTFG